ncbi:hypothetical protein DFH27DRAFT_613319 [Peziza echinospora]|nr:hypothetical protein DFH27DRAFT_613319 [Peziza echinospora]
MPSELFPCPHCSSAFASAGHYYIHEHRYHAGMTGVDSGMGADVTIFLEVQTRGQRRWNSLQAAGEEPEDLQRTKRQGMSGNNVAQGIKATTDVQRAAERLAGLLPGCVVGDNPNLIVRDPKRNPLHSFNNTGEYLLGRWFHIARVSHAEAKEYFQYGLQNRLPAKGLPPNVAFAKSGQTLHNKLNELGGSTEPEWSVFTMTISTGKMRFFCCDILPCIAYFLQQMSFQEHMVYAPAQDFDDEGEQVYFEMLIQIWSVYMTIGNITSEVQNRPSAHAWIPIALLPILPTKVKLSAAAKREAKRERAGILHQVMSRFRSLPQYSSEVCKTMHKGLKDGYRHSNKVDATQEIQWTKDLSLPAEVLEAVKQTFRGSKCEHGNTSGRHSASGD